MTTPWAIRSTSARFTAGIVRVAHRLTPRDVGTGIVIGVIAAVAVVASIVSAPGVIGFLGACLAVLMVAIAVIDWRNFTIPNALNAAGFCLGLAHALVQQPGGMLLAVALALLRGAALAFLFLTIRYGYSRIRKRQGLGLGDVKLAGVAGAWLDWSTMPLAVEIAAFAALAVYAMRQLILGRPISATSRLPFGLFFAPAIWICWFIGMTFLAPI
jgi:leader peptidase (prepilin peptidase) / N-methyltransferase